MLRQWMDAVSRSLQTNWAGSKRVRSRRARLGLENLEPRLAMSSCPAGALVDLNLIVVNASGREMIVSPYQRHSTALKRPQLESIQPAPGIHVVRPAPDGHTTKDPGELYAEER